MAQTIAIALLLAAVLGVPIVSRLTRQNPPASPVLVLDAMLVPVFILAISVVILRG